MNKFSLSEVYCAGNTTVVATNIASHKHILYTITHPAIPLWDCIGILLTINITHRCTLKEFSIRLLHLFLISLFLFSATLHCLFLWDVVLLLLLEVGLIAIHPHALSKLHPQTAAPSLSLSLSLGCGGQPDLCRNQSSRRKVVGGMCERAHV